MKNFDAIFNCMFLAVFGYHVCFFLVQYYVLKRVEFFHYSMFLFSASIYYWFFVSGPMLEIKFQPFTKSVFSAFEMSFSFIQTYFYNVFIIAYLGLANTKLFVYRFLRFYKYYNLVFIFVFIVLGILKIQSRDFFAMVSLLAIPFLLTMLFFMRRLYTVYSNIVVLGTSFGIIGTVGSFIAINYEVYTHAKLPFHSHVPAQIGLLFDLFILGYGLSLKSAESDKKLVKSLQENQKLLETERSRLARDLHDGLGGLLSGVKLTLGSMNGTIILPGKNANIFTRAIDQLDNAIAEMRRVAHSMMPEALLKFGIAEAIEDLCDSINESGKVTMKFTSLGILAPIEKSCEVTLYRMVQELTNNAIKHASAGNIFIQLNKHQRGLTLTVEDDGKGFDMAKISSGKSAGLQNVQSRVDYLKGSMEMDSIPGKGTSITIEIPV